LRQWNGDNIGVVVVYVGEHITINVAVIIITGEYDEDWLSGKGTC